MFGNNLKIINKNNNLTVITETQIPAQVPIYEFGGDIYNKNNLPPQHTQELILQIGNDLYLGPSGKLDDVINHSCNPNCYIHVIGKRVILYSLYVIPKNTELNYDYSLSSTDTLENWKMDCKCGDFECRKVISGFQYLSDNLKDKYKKMGILPLFIDDKRFK